MAYLFTIITGVGLTNLATTVTHSLGITPANLQAQVVIHQVVVNGRHTVQKWMGRSRKMDQHGSRGPALRKLRGEIVKALTPVGVNTIGTNIINVVIPERNLGRRAKKKSTCFTGVGSLVTCDVIVSQATRAA